MATKALRRPANRPERSAYSRPVGGPSKSVCIYWAAGRCTKESCRFLHPGAPESSMNLHISKQKALVWTREETSTGKGNAYNAPQKNNAAQKGNAYNAHQKSIAAQKGNATQKSNPGPTSNATQTSNAIQKSQVCKYWVDGNCVKGDRCLYLHKWFSGKGFSMLAKLQGHKKSCCILDSGVLNFHFLPKPNLMILFFVQQGVLDLAGMTDPETKPILLCSCNDNSVRLLELPSFSERGRLFAKREIRRIGVGPGGLFFSGDATGLVSVWKWMEPYNKVESS
ncbi:unnamed protein product [Malus baccata var. baccata]